MKAANHFNPEPHPTKFVVWNHSLIKPKPPKPQNVSLFIIWSQQFSHKAIHKWELMGINSYWWVLNSSAFKETGRKARQWWTERWGAGEGGDTEHFWTNFPRMPRSAGCPAKGKGVGLHCRGHMGHVLRSGPTIQLVWGPCMCVRPRPLHSPYTPQHSTIWICTRTWWFAWLLWCRSPVHSTWPHSRLCRVMSYCKPALLCPGNLHRVEKS